MPATAAGLTSAMPSLSPLENAFERMHHRLATYALPIAAKATGFALQGLPCRPGETHHSHGFCRSTAAWTGDAGDRDRDRGATLLQRALRHLARGLFAHGAMLLQRRAFHAEHLPLRFVRVGDEGAVEPAGGAADRRHRLR